jgi:hypothetical protein
MIVELPNWKMKKKPRTPSALRTVMMDSASEYLNSTLMTVKQGNFFSKGRKSAAAVERGDDKGRDKCEIRPHTAGIKLYQKSKRIKVKKAKDSTKLNGLDTPVGLVVMEQFRRGLLKEVERYSGELTPAKLQMIRNSSVQKELLDMNTFMEEKQRVKLKKEMLSRSPLDNAIYMLRAMPKKERTSVVKELNCIIPEGTRFIKCQRLLR